jgi:hypothetical protein
MKLRIRNDKYHGWTVSFAGCDHPMARARQMYGHQRRKGSDRRVSLAQAVYVVFGSRPAFRYLIRRFAAPFVPLPDTEGQE